MKKVLAAVIALLAILAAFLFFRAERAKAPETLPQNSARNGDQSAGTKTEYSSYLIVRGEASFSSLKENLPKLDIVIAEWLQYYGAGLKEENPSVQAQQLKYIRENSGAKAAVLINNYSGGWRGIETGGALRNQTKRLALEGQIENYIKQKALDGVSIDFENIPAEFQPDLIVFLSELHTIGQKDGFTLSVHVPADDPAWNYKRMAAAVDQEIVMSYVPENSDNNWQQHAAEIPANKLVIGVMGSAAKVLEVINQSKKYAPAGYALYRLGAEDPAVWNFFGR